MEQVTSENWQQDIDLIVEAAREAGDVARSFWGQSPEVWWKNGGVSPVSAADYAANEVLEARLRPARPSYGWLSEESEDDPARLAASTLFVVDPIDGTRAFLAGRRTWCVSVAVVHHGRPVAGVLYAPAFGETFVAGPSGPATLNGSPITVDASRPGGPVRFATGSEMLARLADDFAADVERVDHVPSLAYRLAMIAAGRIDGTLVMRSSHDWDLAAADLILQRAGGQLVTLEGEPVRYNGASVSHGELYAASDWLLPKLLSSIRRS
ncbi:3'(2'),5'-bisphosphate nucleotidase CysQ [Rhizobium sp. PAMB 3174]